MERNSTNTQLALLLGCNEATLEEMFTTVVQDVTSVKPLVSAVTNWADLVTQACTGRFNLAIVMPNNLLRDDPGATDDAPGEIVASALRRIKASSPIPILVLANGNDFSRHRTSWLDAGADGVLEFPLPSQSLVDAIKQIASQSHGP